MKQLGFPYWNRKQSAPFGQIHHRECFVEFRSQSSHGVPWHQPGPRISHLPATYRPIYSTNAQHIPHYQSTDRSAHFFFQEPVVYHLESLQP